MDNLVDSCVDTVVQAKLPFHLHVPVNIIGGLWQPFTGRSLSFSYYRSILGTTSGQLNIINRTNGFTESF